MQSKARPCLHSAAALCADPALTVLHNAAGLVAAKMCAGTDEEPALFRIWPKPVPTGTRFVDESDLTPAIGTTVLVVASVARGLREAIFRPTKFRATVATGGTANSRFESDPRQRERASTAV